MWLTFSSRCWKVRYSPPLCQLRKTNRSYPARSVSITRIRWVNKLTRRCQLFFEKVIAAKKQHVWPIALGESCCFLMSGYLSVPDHTFRSQKCSSHILTCHGYHFVMLEVLFRPCVLDLFCYIFNTPLENLPHNWTIRNISKNSVTWRSNTYFLKQLNHTVWSSYSIMPIANRYLHIRTNSAFYERQNCD